MANSRLKYVLVPGWRPPAKVTVPEVASALMSLNITPGPSYPVGPKGQPGGRGLNGPPVKGSLPQIPSPSNPRIEFGPLMGIASTAWDELFCTPMKVSSIPSYGP